MTAVFYRVAMRHERGFFPPLFFHGNFDRYLARVVVVFVVQGSYMGYLLGEYIKGTLTVYGLLTAVFRRVRGHLVFKFYRFIFGGCSVREALYVGGNFSGFGMIRAFFWNVGYSFRIILLVFLCELGVVFPACSTVFGSSSMLVSATSGLLARWV